MDYYLNYEGGRINFSLPSGWNVLTCQGCSAVSELILFRYQTINYYDILLQIHQ